MNGRKLEKSYVREITDAIHKLDPQAFIRKLHSSIYGSGLPDAIIVTNCKTIWIEFKRPGGKLTGQQKSTLSDIVKAGGTAYAFVATSRQQISVLVPPDFEESWVLNREGDTWVGLDEVLGVERVRISFP